MKIINCKLREHEGVVDILIEDGVIKEIGANLIKDDSNIIDAKGNYVCPPFVEPHIHLDCVQTAGDPKWNMSGTLFEGIERWAERKSKLTFEDVISRATITIKECVARGIQFFRTHVDITDPTLTALKAMQVVRENLKGICEIQIVAFPQEGILSFHNGKKLIEQAIEIGIDAIGAIPHYEFTREYGVESIKYVLDLAVKHNKLVDIHCDEIDDEQSRFLETVAAEALKLGIGHKVTASHTCAMGSYNDAYTYKLFNVLKKSGINFVACPTESIHLQGRMDTYPKRRGLTRVKEINEAGMNICFAQDSIVDPWYPFGNGNILNVLFHGLHITQIMGYRDIENALDFITYNGAKTLNISDKYGIEIGKEANLIILDGDNEYDIIRTQAEVLYSIKAGRVISQTVPAIRTLKEEYFKC